MIIIFHTLLLLHLYYVVTCLPNFVIFLADDVGYGDIGCFGNDTIKTPNVDALAEKGVKLKHHLNAASLCTPSRAAFLTGRYPIRYGLEPAGRNRVILLLATSGGLPKNETTFARALKQKGYSTALIGKWHLGNDCEFKGDMCHHPLSHGFDYFYGLPLSNFKDYGDEGLSVITSNWPNFYSYIVAIVVSGCTTTLLLRRHKLLAFVIFTFAVVSPTLLALFTKNLHTINGVVMRNGVVVEQPVVLPGLTQRFVKEAIAFIQQQAAAKKPFLLYMPFVHAHTALFCAPEFKGVSKHGPYGDNIEEMDWAVGEIVKTLKSLNIYKDTLTFFSSDNGAHPEEKGKDGRRDGGYNGIFRGGKGIAGFEAGIRAPSIISWPEKFPSKKEVNFPTSQMDIFPTILEAAGIDLQKEIIIDGKSLFPVLKQERNQSLHEFLFHYCGKEIHAVTYIPDNGHNVWKIHWTTPKFLPGKSTCYYICHCFGDFVVHHSPPLLYDLSKDPSESHPLDVSSSNAYVKIIIAATNARLIHEELLSEVPDQLNFSNAIWKPWLQPCCNFPFCKCKDTKWS